MAVACDGASSNRSFYKMHRPISGIVAPDVVYRTINLFDESRYIWFFSDTPHLMKTSRNCFYHSGSGPSKTRLMWNDGKEIIWDHILYAYHLQENKGLKLITKLKEEHVYLTPYSKMNVRLATQVLSETVAKYFYTYHSEVYHGTAEFCSMMDKFFDIFNVKNNIEYISSSKPFLRPFSCFDDSRLSWLSDVFLRYFENWRDSIEKREGHFSLSDKRKMFISHQTYLGIIMNVRSLTGLVSYILRHKNDHIYDNSNEDIQDFLLTGKISQDCTEENFGKHRSVGRRNDNPSLHQFGYDSNMIRMARNIMPVTGNTEGAHRNKNNSWSIVDNAPLPKRRK